MLRILIFGLMLAFAGAASAQLHRWVDKDGKVRYGDTPPPGVKTRTLGSPPGSTPPAAGDDAAKDDAAMVPAAKDAPKGPLTPTEQEQAFRKRQTEARKSQEKEELARKDNEAKQANCTRAREALATYDSGQRVARTNPQGERYYLDDDVRAAEAVKARQAVSDWCG